MTHSAIFEEIQSLLCDVVVLLEFVENITSIKSQTTLLTKEGDIHESPMQHFRNWLVKFKFLQEGL